MEIEYEMEVEKKSAPNSALFKRHGLKNSIQTSFGDDYVFQIAAKYDFRSRFLLLFSDLRDSYLVLIPRICRDLTVLGTIGRQWRYHSRPMR